MTIKKERIPDWKKIEEGIGFPLHPDLKEFYMTFSEGIKGSINFTEDKFIEKTGNPKYDTWFSWNDCEGTISYEIDAILPLEYEDDIVSSIISAFDAWTGGNDFGHRAMLGQFFFNIGQILILYNNDTGNVEWIDCGYGYFDVYEDNPNGVMAYSIKEFLKKLDFCESLPEKN